MPKDSSSVLVEKRDNVLYVCINRPEKRNALAREVLSQLKEIFTAYSDDETLKLAILTGASDKSFAAGGDLKDLYDVRSPEQTHEMSDQANECLEAVRQFPLPVIAALNGDALGGGSELAIACDFRLAARHARIGFIQGKLSITTAWGGGPDLVNLLGSTQALRLLTTSQILTAEEARQIGLIEQITEPEQSLDTLIDVFIAPILEKTNTVLRGFKALSKGKKDGMTREQLRELEAGWLVRSWTEEPHWQAVDRFMNSRKKK